MIKLFYIYTVEHGQNLIDKWIESEKYTIEIRQISTCNFSDDICLLTVWYDRVD